MKRVVRHQVASIYPNSNEVMRKLDQELKTIDAPYNLYASFKPLYIVEYILYRQNPI